MKKKDYKPVMKVSTNNSEPGSEAYYLAYVDKFTDLMTAREQLWKERVTLAARIERIQKMLEKKMPEFLIDECEKLIEKSEAIIAEAKQRVAKLEEELENV